MNLYQPTITGSLSVSGSVNISGSITIAGGGTISGTASIATTALTASSADNLLVRNTLTATTLVVQTVTSSVIYSSGSNVFGNSAANTQVMTGSLLVTGSSTFSGSVTATDLIISDTYANDPLIKLVTTTSGNVEVQMRTATTTYNAGIGVVTSGYDFSLFTNNTTRMTIGSGGSIGMGTTNLIYAALNIKASGTALYNGIALYSTDGTETFLGIGNSGTECGFFATYGANGAYIPITFSTGGSERMRIKANGVISIIGPSATNPTNLSLTCITSTGNNDTLRISTSLENSGKVSIESLAGSGNRAVYSDSTGLLTNSSSDVTLKKNVANITYGLNSIMSLRPISYNWIPENLGAQNEIGFIAQEVQSIIPEVIGINSDDTLSLDYPKLTAVLVKAIQEQQAQIEAQQQQINTLLNK